VRNNLSYEIIPFGCISAVIILILALILLIFSLIKKKKKIFITSIILIVICILIFSVSWINYRTYFHNGSKLHGISINYYSYKSTGIELGTDFNFSRELFDQFDNDTMKLEIELPELNQSLIYHYKIYLSKNRPFYEKVATISNYFDDLQISNPKENYPYRVIFHYIFNIPEVNNITVMGINNYLNFTFIVKNKWDINITLDPEFKEFSYMLGYDHGFGEIWIVEPSNGDRDGIPGHVIRIRTQVKSP
jgi:hypothetical protein